MQLLFMYLALFFGTLLTDTTDAAPRGLKKDDDPPSLGRIRKLKVGKHSGVEVEAKIYTIGIEPLQLIDTTVQVRKNGGPKKPKPLDDSNFPDAESTCDMLEAFDNRRHDENKMEVTDGHGKWKVLCDGFRSMDHMFCPTDEAVTAICAEDKFPHHSPAVKNVWCIPMFGMIKDTERRDDCIKYCTNYVSTARGGCCDVDCGDDGM
jgi:hypothetical protein